MYRINDFSTLRAGYLFLRKKPCRRSIHRATMRTTYCKPSHLGSPFLAQSNRRQTESASSDSTKKSQFRLLPLILYTIGDNLSISFFLFCQKHNHLGFPDNFCVSFLCKSENHKKKKRNDTNAVPYSIFPKSVKSPTHQKSAIAALCNKSIPSNPTKNFPQEHPPQTERNKSSYRMGGCSWGKFSGGQGGLEGRTPSPKEGVLRLQGLSLPSLTLSD